jgi:hypothetical protein
MKNFTAAQRCSRTREPALAGCGKWNQAGKNREGHEFTRAAKSSNFVIPSRPWPRSRGKDDEESAFSAACWRNSDQVQFCHAEQTGIARLFGDFARSKGCPEQPTAGRASNGILLCFSELNQSFPTRRAGPSMAAGLELEPFCGRERSGVLGTRGFRVLGGMRNPLGEIVSGATEPPRCPT